MIKFSELNTTKRCEGLVPAIIQDDNTRQVLMLGYMNEEAYDKTVAEGRVTFFSRAKNRLWTKGETSGNFLNVKSIVKDCDDDTLLIRVVPVGPVCHKGTKTCFGGRENEGFIGENDIFTQPRDRPPRQDVVVVAAEQAAELLLSGHNERHDLAVIQVNFRIADVAEPLTGALIDDFFISQVG